MGKTVSVLNNQDRNIQGSLITIARKIHAVAYSKNTINNKSQCPVCEIDVAKGCMNFPFTYEQKFIQHIEIHSNREVIVTMCNKCTLQIYSLLEKRVFFWLKEKTDIVEYKLVENSPVVVYATKTYIRTWNFLTSSIVNIMCFSSYQISCLSLSNHSKYLALGCTSGEIHIISMQKCSLKISLINHQSQVQCLDFSNNCQYLISSGGTLDINSDCYIRIWNVKHKSLIAVLSGHGYNVYYIKFQRSGNHFVSISQDLTIKIWDFQEIIRENSNEECGKYVDDDRKKTFLNHHDLDMNIMNIKDNFRYKAPSRKAKQCYKMINEDYLNAIFSMPKEKSEKFSIKLKDKNIGAGMMPLVEGFFLEGSEVVIIVKPMEYVIESYDLIKYKRIKKISYTPVSPLINSCFHLDSNSLFYINKSFLIEEINCTENSRIQYKLPLNDIATSELFNINPLTKALEGLHKTKLNLSNNNLKSAQNTDDSVQFPFIIENYICEKKKNYKENLNDTEKVIRINDGKINDALNTLRDTYGFDYGYTSTSINKIHLNKFLNVVYTISSDIYIQIWPIISNTYSHILKASEKVMDFTVFENEKLIYYNTLRQVKIWNYEENIILNIYDSKSIITKFGIASKPGFIIIGTETGRLVFWNYETKQLECELGSHSGPIRILVISEDNHILATAEGQDKGNFDGNIRLWDLPRKMLIKCLTGHAVCITKCIISKFSDYIITAGYDCTLRLWDLSSVLKQHNINGFRFRIKKVLNLKEKISSKALLGILQKSYTLIKKVGPQGEARQNYILKVISKIHTKYEKARLCFPYKTQNENIMSDYSLLLSESEQFLYAYNPELKSIDMLNIDNLIPLKHIFIFSDKFDFELIKATNDTINIYSSGTITGFNIETGQKNVRPLLGFFLALKNFIISDNKLVSIFISKYETFYSFSVWDISKMKYVGYYKCGPNPIINCLICKNTCVTMHENSEIKVWDLSFQTTTIVLYKGANTYNICKISDNGVYLIVYSTTRNLFVWNLKNYSLIVSIDNFTCFHVSFFKIENMVKCVGFYQGTLVVWNPIGKKHNKIGQRKFSVFKSKNYCLVAKGKKYYVYSIKGDEVSKTLKMI